MDTRLAGGRIVAGAGHGDPLTWKGVPVNAVQAGQTLHSTATGGTFTISDGTGTTPALDAHLGTAAAIGAAVNALPGLIAAGGVVATGGPFGTADIVLTWNHGGPRTLLTVDPTLATGGTVTITSSTTGVQGTFQSSRPAVGAALDDLTAGTRYFNTGTSVAPVWTALTVP